MFAFTGNLQPSMTPCCFKIVGVSVFIVEMKKKSFVDECCHRHVNAGHLSNMSCTDGRSSVMGPVTLDTTLHHDSSDDSYIY